MRINIGELEFDFDYRRSIYISTKDKQYEIGQREFAQLIKIYLEAISEYQARS